MKTIATRSSLV